MPIEARPLRILAYGSDMVACSWQRLFLPCHWLQKLGLAEVKWGEKESDAAIEWADLVVYQRWYSGRPHAWFQELWRCGVPLVYELDDNVWALTDDNPFKPFYTRENLDAMEEMVRKASLVTVPSMGLARALEPWARRIAVIPSGVDPGIFDLETVRYPGEVRLGYGGSKTHDRDFLPLLSPLAEVFSKYPQVRLVVIGEPPRGLKDVAPKNRVVQTGWVTWEGTKDRPSLYQVLAQSGVEIALVPLKDNVFNRGKSAIKYYEFGAVGACVVAADVAIFTETIRHGETGMLIPGNSDLTWSRTLRQLIEDAPLRQRLGEAARADVQKRFSYDVLAPRWAEAYRSVART